MEISLDYIAGFFDGEGSIGIYKNSNKKNPGFFLRTQLTQNKNKTTTGLMTVLKNRYGGNVSEQKTLSGRIKYNWQLNSTKAVVFLHELLPCLILKKDQAMIAVDWQMKRPLIVRDKRGRISLKSPKDLKEDKRVSMLLKKLKK